MPLNFDISRLLRTPKFAEEDDPMGELIAARRPPALPELREPSSAPLSVAGDPGSMAGPSYGSRPQSRYEQMNEARDVYMQKRPSRLKAGILGGLHAVGEGGADDLGQAFGQGIGGIIGGLINPRGVRERQFNQRVRPQIEERFRYEDAENQAARQAEEGALTRAYRIAQTEALNRSNRPQPPRPRQPITVAPGSTAIDPETGQPIFTAPAAAPKPPSPRWARDERGRFVNLNDPANAGKEIRGYDRPRAPRGAPKPKEDKDAKARERAVAEFNNTKQALNEATGRGDKAQIDQLRQKLQGMSANIAARYGNQYETGSGEWPYIKQRGGQQGGGLTAQQRAVFNEIKSEQPGASDDRILDYMRKKGLM